MYEYDAFQRNTKVETFDGNIQIKQYDAEGLRHEVEENGTLISYLYRGTEVVVEETKEETTRYIRTNELVASDAESARTYYHYASDELGSITHVTEESSILNHYEYDAWGNLITCEETIPNRFRFNGQQYDPVSQQYYLRARYYNPVIGRFTQEDTYRGDGLNLYAYCRNNPVYYVDPSGHNGECGNGSQKTVDNITTNTSNASKQENQKAKGSGGGTETSRTNWGAEHGKGNVKHNNAIETELDNASANGATDIRKNRVQRDVNGNRVYATDGRSTRPDASYVIDGKRYNTNYISNYNLDNIDELNREIEAFNRMCDADPDAVARLIFKY